jgi:hypothetical protein
MSNCRIIGAFSSILAIWERLQGQTIFDAPDLGLGFDPEKIKKQIVLLS